MRRTFPARSVTSILPQVIGERFGATKLLGKLYNAVDEVPVRPIEDASTLKSAITGKNPITAEPKGKDAFDFIATAGWIVGANHWLRSDDQSNGFYRRWVIISWNTPLEPHQVVRGFDDVIIAQERSAIVAWSLQGAVRALRQNGYTVPASHHTLMSQWRSLADSVQSWLDQSCDELPPDTPNANWSAPQPLYDSFVAWCEKDGRQRMSKDQFTHRLERWRKHTKHGNRYRLRLRNEQPQDTAEDEAEIVAALNASVPSASAPTPASIIVAMTALEQEGDRALVFNPGAPAVSIPLALATYLPECLPLHPLEITFDATGEVISVRPVRTMRGGDCDCGRHPMTN